MNLILLAALVAVCGAAKLDRTYLPPASAKTAGGSPGSLETPFEGNSFNDRSSSGPKGSYNNDFQGVVVDAANPGTRQSGEGETGLGGPRKSYGSTDSRVGDAAFRDAPNFRPLSQESSEQRPEDGQSASSQVSSQEFNKNRFGSSSNQASSEEFNRNRFGSASNQAYSGEFNKNRFGSSSNEASSEEFNRNRFGSSSNRASSGESNKNRFGSASNEESSKEFNRNRFGSSSNRASSEELNRNRFGSASNEESSKEFNRNRFGSSSNRASSEELNRNRFGSASNQASSEEFNQKRFGSPNSQASSEEFNQNRFGSSSQASSDEFNQDRFASRGQSKPERAQAAADRSANILRYENEVGPEAYHFAYETDNGISAEENGLAILGVQAQGGFSYTGDDGLVYSITYTADEGGYQPRGSHLPTPPPIPEEILKALEKNAKDEAAGVIDDGSYDAQRYNAGGDYTESDSGNTEYNDRQPPKFGKRPESDATASGTFIDQNSQEFRPNQNSFESQRGSSEESQGSNAVSSSSSSERFGQSSQKTRPSNGFDSGKEYLPPSNRFNQNRRPFAPSGTNAPDYNGFSDNSQTTTSQPQNYQGLQSSSNFGRPGSNRLDVLAQSASKENSVENSRPSSNGFSQSGQSSSQSVENSSGSRAQYLPPRNTYRKNGNTQNLRPRPTTSSGITETDFNSFSQNSGSSQDNNVSREQSSSSVENGSASQSAEQFNGFQKRPQSSNNRFSQNRFQTAPTSQPSSELTTPFESNEQGSTSQPSSSTSNYKFSSSSRGQNRPSFTNSAQDFSSSSKEQNKFNRPSSSSNQQSSEETRYENVRDLSDVQYASTTQTPTFGQPQGPDDSYYYRQPSRPFNTPSDPRFPGASSSQFDTVGSSQYSQENSFQPQDTYNRGTVKYPEPPTLAPPFPTVSFDQFQGSTPSAQYTEASISPFQPLNQGTTNYYQRPTTLLPTAPTTQYNGITQATASSFPAVPTISYNTGSFQPSPFYYQGQSQETSQFDQGASNQGNYQDNSEPQVATQQYSGEIYEYNKPTQGLSAPSQQVSQGGQSIPESQPTISQFDATQGSSNVQEYTQQPTSPTFGSSQFDSQRTQFNQYNSQEQSQDSRPQFNSQSSFEKVRPTGAQNNGCCQSLDARLQPYRGVPQGTAPVPTQSQFGSQFTGPTSQTVSQNSGFGEEFGGPRQPPSFDQDTGYHY